MTSFCVKVIENQADYMLDRRGYFLLLILIVHDNRQIIGPFCSHVFFIHFIIYRLGFSTVTKLNLRKRTLLNSQGDKLP